MQRLGAFGFAQVAVARTQRQAIGGAACGAAGNFDRQGKLAHHLPDHHELLVVLFAKHRHALGFAGKHGHEEFHHHGGHAGEKAGAKVAFQNVGQRRVGVHFDGLRFGVQIVLTRCKQHIATGGLQLGAVVVPGAGVVVKVFVRQELQAVDKNTGHGAVAQRLGLLD